MKWRLIITRSHHIRGNGDQSICICLACIREFERSYACKGFRHSARNPFHGVMLHDGWRSFASSLCIFAVPFPRLVLQPPRSSLRSSLGARSRKFNLNISTLMIASDARMKVGVDSQGRCRRPIKVHFNWAIDNLLLIADLSLCNFYLLPPCLISLFRGHGQVSEQTDERRKVKKKFFFNFQV